MSDGRNRTVRGKDEIFTVAMGLIILVKLTVLTWFILYRERTFQCDFYPE